MPQTHSNRKDQSDLERVALNCHKVKWNSGHNGFIACCPCHADKNPSLSVTLKDGKLLAKCHAGCDQDSVIEALGIAGDRGGNVLPFNPDTLKVNGKAGRKTGRKAGQWTYEAVAGERVVVTRIEYPDGSKDFPNQPTGVKGPFLPLAWRQPGFDPAALVIVEGEKCVEAVRMALAEADLPDWSVTTWIGGSGAVGKTNWSSISGLKVILWPDSDEAGRKAMRQVQDALPANNEILLANVEGLKDKQDAADLQPANIVERIRSARPAPKPGVELVPFSTLTARPIEWIIPGWLPRGKISLLAGQPGMGKTTLAIKIASLVTTGGKWADGTRISRGRVVGVFGEDELEDTIYPNLLANGADCDKIAYPGKATTDIVAEAPFDPAAHLDLLTETLRKQPDCRLVIIDPAMALAKNAKDEYRAGDIREALEPVQDLAKQANVAILVLAHFLKRHNSSGSGVLDRVSGSQAWTQVARMVWAADSTDTGKALMKVKANTAESEGGFAYSIREIPLPVEFRGKAVPGRELTFGAAVAGDADKVFGSAKPEADRDAPARDAAREFLEILFAERQEPISWADLKAEGRREGYTAKTLERARDQLRAEGQIRPKRIGKQWFWAAEDANT